MENLRHEEPCQEDVIAVFTRFMKIMVECAIDFLHVLEARPEPDCHDDYEGADQSDIDVPAERMAEEYEAC